MRRLLRSRMMSDGMTLAVGQGVSALGTIIGIRLLTEVVSPGTFGIVTLAIGVAALAMNSSSTPVTQAVLHFYPALEQGGSIAVLRAAVRNCLGRVAGVLGLVLLLALGAALLFGERLWLLALLVAAVLAVDILRAMELAFLNAGRRHVRYAGWFAAEAWGRPLVAVAAVLWIGDSAAVVLGAYLLASGTLLLLFGPGARADLAARSGRPDAASAGPADAHVLSGRIWTYALPLIPLGLVGWFNGLGDRYIISGILSVADAGIYAASYGLVSRPFLMLGQTIELTVRPVYQQRVSSDPADPVALRLLWLWLAAVTTAGGIGVAVVTFWSGQIASLLLGVEFRAGAMLMPWIAGGYCLLIMSHVFERVCFAYGTTRWVFVIQSSAALAGLLATTIGTLGWGLPGAAVAVPVCFLVQLAVSVMAARHTRSSITKGALAHG